MRKKQINEWLYHGSLWINRNPRVRYAVIGLAILFALLSLVFADNIRRKMVEEEYQRTALWARATQAFASRDESLSMDLIADIVSSNKSIPVILTDKNGRIVNYNNIDLPEEESSAFLEEKLDQFRKEHPPIIVDGIEPHYLYYSDSAALQRLAYFPYLQFGYFLVLIMGIVIVIRSIKRSDQNRIWEGLSRETAHQLGTPISSLIAWKEYLIAMGTDSLVTTEIGKDIERLETIANRFQKIGSAPNLQPVELSKVIQYTLDYLRPRISSQVSLGIAETQGDEKIQVSINESLFVWVLENLIKNAVDAMEGKGKITLSWHRQGERVRIDVQDTGRGIPRSKQREVFRPGYTTRKRGWGLGLSLARRIVEDYHHGQIFVHRSEIGVGTTFRIILSTADTSLPAPKASATAK